MHRSSLAAAQGVKSPACACPARLVDAVIVLIIRSACLEAAVKVLETILLVAFGYSQPTKTLPKSSPLHDYRFGLHPKS